MKSFNKFSMQKKIALLLGTMAALPFASMAQNEIDALRYGQLSVGGTALSMSLGGAGGSMGADFSGLSINPASIGVYRRSEFTITPSLRINQAVGKYAGEEATESNTRFNLANFGMVFTKSAAGKNYDRADWKSVSFGLGYNRLADFNQRYVYSGFNNQSSISEVFAADAFYNGISDKNIPPYGYLGYEGFLLDDNFQSIVPWQTGLYQTKYMRSRGNAGEWVISVGGNYREKLMLGATVGIQSYKFERETEFVEEDATDNARNNFKYLSYKEFLNTTGVGVNIKLGAIVVVSDAFKLGFAAHTPTWSSFSDISDYNLLSHTENYKADNGYSDINPETFVQPEAESQFNYSLRTPWRGVVSGTMMLGRNGMITADYELVDYGSMRYNMPDYVDYENYVNSAISNTFKFGHNVRVGVEGRHKNYMGRLGFAYYSSPFKESDLFDGQRMNLSLGLGARFGAFFLDLAYVHSIVKDAEFGYPASVVGLPTYIANIQYNRNTVALTLGLKF
jgi:hypothetical protein